MSNKQVKNHTYYGSNLGPTNLITRETLLENIDSYVDGLINGKSKKAAYEAAGYASSNTGSNASKFHKKYQKEIHLAYNKKIGEAVPVALATLLEIMTKGKSETARTKCALEVLDRAGHDKTTKIQVASEEPKSREELESKLQTLLSNSPVNIIDAAPSIGLIPD